MSEKQALVAFTTMTIAPAGESFFFSSAASARQRDEQRR